MPGHVADMERSLGIVGKRVPMSAAESVTGFESEPTPFPWKSNFFPTWLECLILM